MMKINCLFEHFQLLFFLAYWLWEIFTFSHVPLCVSHSDGYFVILIAFDMLIEVLFRIKINFLFRFSFSCCFVWNVNFIFNWLNFCFYFLFHFLRALSTLPAAVQCEYWNIWFSYFTSANDEYLAKWKYPNRNWNLFDWYAVLRFEIRWSGSNDNYRSHAKSSL